jgi:hypothetical protein
LRRVLKERPQTAKWGNGVVGRNFQEESYIRDKDTSEEGCEENHGIRICYEGYTHKTSGFKTSGFKTSETSGLQNVRFTKPQVYKMSG